MDALVVIGTALETNLARKLVNESLKKIDIPVIEINLESVIEYGFNIRVLDRSEVALPALFEELYKL